MRVVVRVFKALILALGLVAVLHLVSVRCGWPVVFMVEVVGDSMAPTLDPGERAMFVRAPWHRGDIVVADVGEDQLVVKRVAGHRADWVYLAGDNWRVSRTYWVQGVAIKSVMLCRVPLLRGTKTYAATEVFDEVPSQHAWVP